MYKLYVVEKEVHEWSNENGEGKHIANFSMDMSIMTHSLNPEEVAKSIVDMLFLEEGDLKATDIKECYDFMEDTKQNFFIISVVEDENANRDNEGKYLADYFIEIEKNERVEYEEVAKYI